MPLVKIDIVKGSRTPDGIRKLADTVQQVMIEHFNAPNKDRYQVSLNDREWLGT
jgi:phenylpyruvate tautomerase PptA (4-oxalocrotonate tautomerase family)